MWTFMPMPKIKELSMLPQRQLPAHPSESTGCQAPPTCMEMFMVLFINISRPSRTTRNVKKHYKVEEASINKVREMSP